MKTSAHALSVGEPERVGTSGEIRLIILGRDYGDGPEFEFGRRCLLYVGEGQVSLTCLDQESAL